MARRPHRNLATLAFMLAGFLPGQTQNPATPILAFDAVSIKPARPDNPNSNFNLNEGQLSVENIPAEYLLKSAYGLSTGANDQIVGAPAWLGKDRFDILTVLDEASRSKLQKMSRQEQEQATDQMLKQVLEDRFRLKAHIESRPRDVLVLVVARHGAQLRKFVPCDTCQPPEWKGLHNNNGHVEGRGASLSMLANVLAVQPDVGGRSVVDETNLTGLYSFDLQYSPDAAAQSSGLSLFAALQDQLGLKLESAKRSIPVLVIDQISQPSPD